jgi:hypothetical protein
MSGSREIIDMNLGPVESKRVSSASSLEGETTPDEKKGIKLYTNIYTRILKYSAIHSNQNITSTKEWYTVSNIEVQCNS